MPPPSTTPNSHTATSSTSTGNNANECIVHSESPNEAGITTIATVSTAVITTTSGSTVTSVITTGPDGTSLDDGSQQSTLSNTSAG